ncbi:MAG: hypothetical protein VKS61_08820 [Candidatus Sericytochromatia bacterium]|nr:hypothetical protein [Candidatus Sericytochromatia bacterium]
MSDASIRSFALEYYRKRGAAIQPLEHEGPEAYRITPRQGTSLRVTFADEAPLGDDAPTALTATSPEWRAILDDLTAEVVVSCRYLVCAPIGNPSRTLTEALPPGWAIHRARLKGVENRVALGLSHRVTFDAQALNARREVMHHHVWDVETSERLPLVEPLLYEAPTLLIRPRHYPSEQAVRGLLNRSLLLIDADTDVRGQALEAELADLLRETETRTNQYYEQQMGQVLTREAQLEERLAASRTRLAEARTPDAIARWQQEAGSLQTQLGNARAGREAQLAGIEAACERKLADERERHDLTALTDLVAICYASYDVLTYEVDATLPDGQATTLPLRYWPVTREIAVPPCAACGEPAREAVLQADGTLQCRPCVTACPGCGDRSEGGLAACGACGATVCAACLVPCAGCLAELCAEHLHGAATHDAGICEGCVAAAVLEAEAPTATEPAPPTAAGHEAQAPAVGPVAVEGLGAPAAEAGPAMPAPAAVTLIAAGPEAAAPEAEPVAVAGPEAAAPEVGPTAVAGSETAVPEVGPGAVAGPEAATPEPAPTAVAGPEAAAPEVAPAPAPRSPLAALLAFTGGAPAAPIGAPEEALLPTPDVLRAPVSFTPTRRVDEAHEDQALAALFDAPPAAARPVTLEACPGCILPMDEAELTPCATCGVPACARCVSGDQGPCPACESLAPTVASDPRLAFVTRTFPDLARGGRSWEIAVVDGFVVAHWSRWGTWGMVTYHLATPHAEPTLVAAFRCNHLDVLRQVFSFQRRGA